MSAKAIGWVFDHSPLDGSGLVIHLAIADVVNDTYDNEFWMRREKLAEKAHCSIRTVATTLTKMVELGLLEDDGDGGLTQARVAHKGRCYKMLMPAELPNSDVQILHVVDVQPAQSDVQSTTGSDVQSPHIQGGTQEELSQVEPNEPKGEVEAIEPTSSITADAAFDAFWLVYPKRQGKAPARKAFAKALTKTDPVSLIRAAAAYRDWPGRNPDMTKMAQGWLNDERWNDELPAEARHDEPTQLDKNRTELMKGVDRLNDPAHIPFAERIKRAAQASHPASAALSAPPALRALPGGASPSIPTEAREAP